MSTFVAVKVGDVAIMCEMVLSSPSRERAQANADLLNEDPRLWRTSPLVGTRAHYNQAGRDAWVVVQKAYVPGYEEKYLRPQIFAVDPGVSKGMVAHNPKYDLKALQDVNEAKKREKIRAYLAYGAGMGPARVAGTPISKEPLFDGLTAMQCFERYTVNMKVDTAWPLTPRQKAQAQLMWSAELRAKKVATETKERDRVRVDLEFEEWE